MVSQTQSKHRWEYLATYQGVWQSIRTVGPSAGRLEIDLMDIEPSMSQNHIDIHKYL